MDLIGINIADNHKAKVVGNIATLVILQHILPVEFVVNIEVAYHGFLEGADMIGCAKEE